MSCRALEPSLLLRAHGQLSGMRRLWLDSHLRACPACREKWARWVLERDAMRRALAPPAEVDASAERLMTAVAIRIRTEPREAPPAAAAAFIAPRKATRLLALAVLIVLLACGAAALAALGPLVANIANLPVPWRLGPEQCAPRIMGPAPPGVPIPPNLHGKFIPTPPLPANGKVIPSSPVPAKAKGADEPCLDKRL